MSQGEHATLRTADIVRMTEVCMLYELTAQSPRPPRHRIEIFRPVWCIYMPTKGVVLYTPCKACRPMLIGGVKQDTNIGLNMGCLAFLELLCAA